ncbi:MAG: AAA family ATPase [Bacteroidales bacterium]|jgi:predicted ATPase/signal transduction histidine kinase
MKQFAIPTRLYGRGQEIRTLLESFEHISSGHGQILLVPGPSGVGKTALVHELSMPVRNINGFFITGKFEQYQQNIPYFAFRQALAELHSELKSGNTQEYSRFKAELLESLGNLGQVLVDLVPEFESFLGIQPPLTDISPQEARHRFADVFRNFLKVICRPEHPLVLFIDDWQWADAASCELLRQLQVGITLRYLLVIVSYRDNEVDFGHPLMSAVNDLRSHAVSVEVLQVKNITANDVREIVTDTLKPAIVDMENLASVIHSKTLGNPFFVHSFFSFMYEFNLIWFDNERNHWKWLMDISTEVNMPANVVELFILKLRRLDTVSQNLFSFAACIGNRLDWATLSIISGHSPEECLKMLFSGQAKTFFLPFDSEKGSNLTEDLHVSVTFTFLHDSVQQAAYSLIESSELPSILLKIGRLLITSLRPEQLNERLFEVMNTLNAGSHLIQETTEQVKMVELNITAARKAYGATAYRSALQFYQAANRFLKKPGFAEQLWLDRHEMILSLFKERAECEFLEGDRNEAENCIHEAVAHSGTALEKALGLNILIVQYTLLARYPEAIASGRQALDALGISLPEENFEESRNQEIALVRQELGNRPVSSLVELPVMTNPEMLMASKILITMGPPCYRSHQRLWSVIVPKVVNLTLRYGNIPQVGYSHTAFGGLLGWVDNDYATAKEFGELATQLMTNTFRSPSDQSVFYLMIGSSIRHWFKHLRYGTQDYTDAYEIGLRSGNLQYAAYAFGHNMYCRFYQGIPLENLIQETQHSLEFSQTRLNQWAIDLLEGGLNIFSAMSSESSVMNGNDAWSEMDFLQRVGDHHNIQVTCIYKVLKTFSLILTENYNEALFLSNETEPLIYTVGSQGLLPWPEHVFARILILTALYSKVENEKQIKWHTELDQMMVKLRIWADNCPDNFEHKYLLAAAELARIDDHPIEAIKLYDKAIEAAQKGNFLQWEGIANERTFCFWLESGNFQFAHVYWQQAYVCYHRWGAVAKVNSMEEFYRTTLSKNFPGCGVSGTTDERLELDIKNDVVERQIKQLRNFALLLQQTRLRLEAEKQAGELALATQRLRVEIAERKRTEEALRESENRFHSLFDSMVEGVALHELVFEGEKPVNYRIIDVNKHFEKIIGITREQVAEKLCTDAYGTTTPPYFEEYVAVATNKTPIYFESYFADMDKHFAISATPWQENGFATIFTDISARKQTEDEIKLKNEELLKLDAEKNKFFSIIAHDLRSPFNSFLGLTQIMAEDLPSLTMAQVQDLAISMKNSATNLYNLLENLLQWSQMQQGVMPFIPEVVQLKPMVDECVATAYETAKNKEINIIKTIPENTLVFADSNMFKTIIRNLVSNAIKFTHKGGKVIVSTNAIIDQGVEISIKDSGIGMSREMVENLFRPDVRTGRKGTEGELSTGLGLLLCKEFVKKHGGKIWVESEQGNCSIFHFTLPNNKTHQ